MVWEMLWGMLWDQQMLQKFACFGAFVGPRAFPRAFPKPCVVYFLRFLFALTVLTVPVYRRDLKVTIAGLPPGGEEGCCALSTSVAGLSVFPCGGTGESLGGSQRRWYASAGPPGGRNLTHTRPAAPTGVLSPAAVPGSSQPQAKHKNWSVPSLKPAR